MDYDALLIQESISQSKYSLGVLKDCENVARVLFAPKHIQNSVVLPNAFEQIIHDGLSVLRLGDNFEESLSYTIHQIENDKRKYEGYVCADVLSIRNVLSSGFRLFYLLDTATKPKRAHADIYAIRPHEKLDIEKKGLIQLISYEIAECFTELTLAN